MTARQRAWPRQWLMTDERVGDRLWEAVARLPVGEGGIVLRHYGLAMTERRALAGEVMVACRERNLTLCIAGDVGLAEELDAELAHNPDRSTRLPFSISVHSLDDAARARDGGAALVFVSPVFATRSHPGAESLGPERAAELAKAAGVPAIALGGMNSGRFAQLPPGSFYGWAGIDAWLA